MGVGPRQSRRESGRSKGVTGRSRRRRGHGAGVNSSHGRSGRKGRLGLTVGAKVKGLSVCRLGSKGRAAATTAISCAAIGYRLYGRQALTPPSGTKGVGRCAAETSSSR